MIEQMEKIKYYPGLKKLPRTHFCAAIVFLCLLLSPATASGLPEPPFKKIWGTDAGGSIFTFTLCEDALCFHTWSYPAHYSYGAIDAPSGKFLWKSKTETARIMTATGERRQCWRPGTGPAQFQLLRIMRS